MNKILVYGFFGFRTNQIDGQTIKTRSIYELIKEHSKGVSFFDTQEFRYSPLSIIKFFLLLFDSKTLIFVGAHRNLKYAFPLIWLLCRVLRIKIIFPIVGGWLYHFLKGKTILKAMLRNSYLLLSETQKTNETLSMEYHFNNVIVFPNFRFCDYTPHIIRRNTTTLKIVFMARMNQKKGLDTIFEFGDYLNKIGENRVLFDFYGPLAIGEENWISNNIAKYPFMKYVCTLQPNEIYSVLNQYDVMLLPTHYFTEGFPGSILDAYISGIPVIVTEWEYAHEFVDDNHSGFIVPFFNPLNDIIRKIDILLNEPDLLFDMKLNAIEKSKQYSSIVAWRILDKYL